MSTQEPIATSSSSTAAAGTNTPANATPAVSGSSSPAANASNISTAGTTAASTRPVKTKKAVSIKAVTGFSKLLPNNLVSFANSIVAKLTGNANFPNLPVDLSGFATAIGVLASAIVSAMDGGKAAKAVRDKQRKLVIQDLNLLAVYCQNNCNDDPAIFATSGFTVKSPTKTAGKPVAVPSFKYLDYGPNSGQLVVAVKAVAGARVYFVRYAVMNGAQPGPWT